MKECKKIQNLFMDVFHGELDQNHRQDFDDHLQKCVQCREEFSKINTTLRKMNTYERPEPGEKFWDNYWENLEPKLDKGTGSKFSFREWWQKIIPDIRIEPSWVYGIATATAFLLIGIFIGKFSFTTEKPDFTTETTMSPANIKTVASAEHYLQRSKVILLGIVNMDIDPKTDYKPDISKQQQISRDLIQQTAVLKEDLKETNQKILLELIKEMEVILLQIANLEAEYDLEAVELIQKGMERKGLLIKINLEEILSTSHKNNNQVTKNQSNKKQI